MGVHPEYLANEARIFKVPITGKEDTSIKSDGSKTGPLYSQNDYVMFVFSDALNQSIRFERLFKASTQGLT